MASSFYIYIFYLIDFIDWFCFLHTLKKTTELWNSDGDNDFDDDYVSPAADNDAEDDVIFCSADSRLWKKKK